MRKAGAILLLWMLSAGSPAESADGAVETPAPVWNAGFEVVGPDGGPAGWQPGAWAQDGDVTGVSVGPDTVQAREGGASLSLRFRNVSSVAQATCQQRILVEPDTCYRVEYWARMSTSDPGKTRNTSFLIQRDAADSVLPINPSFSIGGKVGDEWRRLSFVCRTRPEARRLAPVFRLRADGPVKEAELRIDDVRVVRLPAGDESPPAAAAGPAPSSRDTILRRAPRPGTPLYEQAYGPPSLGNVVCNGGFELARTDLAPELRTVYRKLRDDQPIEWVAEGVGDWTQASPGLRSPHCLRISSAQPGFTLRTRSLLAVDETKRCRAWAWVKGRGLTRPACLRIVWRRVHHDPQGRGGGRETLAQSPSEAFLGSDEWRRIEVVGKPPPTAQFALLALDCGVGAGGDLYVDQIVLQGLGDQEIELLHSQAGWTPDGCKDVVVRTKGDHGAAGELRLYPEECGEPVLVKPLQPLGPYRWGRHYYGASFGELRRPGRYFLEARFGPRLRRRSAVFPVREGRYRELLGLGVRWFYFQRSNWAVRGWHEAGFMDDATLYDRGRRTALGRADLTGGWHDAADMNKWTGPEGFYAWVLARTAEQHRDDAPVFRGDPSLPSVLEEAAWGVKYLCNAKAAYPQAGCFAQWVKGGRNVPGSGLEAAGRWCDRATFSPDAVAALAAYARVAGVQDTDRRVSMLSICAQAYPVYDRFYEHCPLSDEFCMTTIAAVNLWRLTGDERYRGSARARIAKLATTVRDADFGEVGLSVKSARQLPGDPSILWPLAVEEFLSACPDDELAPVCRAAVGKFCAWLAGLSVGPLGHTHFQDPATGGARWYASPARHCPYVMICAGRLAFGARLLRRRDWLTIAERDLQYAWGRNLAGVSNMAFVGEKWSSQFTELQAIAEHADGMMPGAVFKGHGIGRGTFWSPHNVRVACMPTGFPHAILPSPFRTYHQTANNEVFGFANSAFILAASEVCRALDALGPAPGGGDDGEHGGRRE